VGPKTAGDRPHARRFDPATSCFLLQFPAFALSSRHADLNGEDRAPQTASGKPRFDIHPQDTKLGVGGAAMKLRGGGGADAMLRISPNLIDMKFAAFPVFLISFKQELACF